MTSSTIQPYKQQFKEDIKGVVSIWDDPFLWGIKIEPCFPGFAILRYL